LPLRTDQYNSDGKLVSKSYFLKLSLGAPPADSLFRPPAGAKCEDTPLTSSLGRLDSLEEVERVCGHRPELPAAAPPGYVVSGYFARRCRKHVTLPVIRYFDGLNSIMVFERLGERGGRGGWHWRRRRGSGRGWERHRGRENCQFQETAQQKVVRFTSGNRSYLIVGDHNREALVRMAASFR